MSTKKILGTLEYGLEIKGYKPSEIQEKENSPILLFIFQLSIGKFPFQFGLEVKTVFSIVASISREKTNNPHLTAKQSKYIF